MARTSELPRFSPSDKSLLDDYEYRLRGYLNAAFASNSADELLDLGRHLFRFNVAAAENQSSDQYAAVLNGLRDRTQRVVRSIGPMSPDAAARLKPALEILRRYLRSKRFTKEGLQMVNDELRVADARKARTWVPLVSAGYVAGVAINVTWMTRMLGPDAPANQHLGVWMMSLWGTGMFAVLAYQALAHGVTMLTTHRPDPGYGPNVVATPLVDCIRALEADPSLG